MINREKESIIEQIFNMLIDNHFSSQEKISDDKFVTDLKGQESVYI